MPVFVAVDPDKSKYGGDLGQVGCATSNACNECIIVYRDIPQLPDDRPTQSRDAPINDNDHGMSMRYAINIERDGRCHFIVNDDVTFCYGEGLCLVEALRDYATALREFIDIVLDNKEPYRNPGWFKAIRWFLGYDGIMTGDEEQAEIKRLEQKLGMTADEVRSRWSEDVINENFDAGLLYSLTRHG
jgi:hypothetical protein